MTYLYHYQGDIVAITSILRDGLRHLSDMRHHPNYSSQVVPFESRYNELALPLLKRPYQGASGIFFTTIDLRRMQGKKRIDCDRLRIPSCRLDSGWSVLTYELGGKRSWLALDESNLHLTADIWTDERAQRWLGADDTGWFRYVPQVVSFQPGGVPMLASDIGRGC